MSEQSQETLVAAPPDNVPVEEKISPEAREARLAELRRLRNHEETKMEMYDALKKPLLPRGWDDQLIGYRVNDGTVGLDDADKFEPVALVKAENPAAQLYVDRLVERNAFYSSIVSPDAATGKMQVLAITTGDDLLNSFLTGELKGKIIAELTERWDELRQEGLIESVQSRNVVSGFVDKAKVDKPLEHGNIYKPGFVTVTNNSPGSVQVARLSRALFGDTRHRLLCLESIPRPTTELRRQAYRAAGREGSQQAIAIPFQFWCEEVMRKRAEEEAP